MNGDVPAAIKNKEIISIDISGLEAGTQYRGSFEENIQNLVNEVKEAGNIILFFDEIHQIHSNYKLYPINYVALDMIQDTRVYEEYYTVEDYQNFNTYLDGQIEKIDIENRDDKFLRTCLLTQYAYPTKNYIAASSESGRFKSLLNRLTFKK